ncbi:hypothetical protein FHW71_004320 [Enterobacter sp. Sphag1F]|nr:hypothetical protein [Enterobacter sp. Sphag1F]NYI16536.1 hypothetical protein [Enterobacter sp. Sphag71]
MPTPCPVSHNKCRHTSGIFHWKVSIFDTIISSLIHPLITKEDYYAIV